MTSIRIIEGTEQPTAGIRERVRMDDLASFFSRAFHDTLEALQEQGVSASGAPFGKYYGTPTETVDVEAGYPIASHFVPTRNVISGVLPGGERLEATHVGPYETIGSAYADAARHMSHANLAPAGLMWETYLSDPTTEPDPQHLLTRICWPVTKTAKTSKQGYRR